MAKWNVVIKSESLLDEKVKQLLGRPSLTTQIYHHWNYDTFMEAITKVTEIEKLNIENLEIAILTV